MILCRFFLLVMLLGFMFAGPARADGLGLSQWVVGPAAGVDSVTLATSGLWTATSDAAWLQPIAGSVSGTGGQHVIYSFTANTGATRTGKLTIGGYELSVTQAGADYQAALGVTTLVSSGLNLPIGVGVNAAGEVFIADYGNHALKRWSPLTNSVTKLADTADPVGAAVDGAGNVFFAENNQGLLKKWTASSNSVSTLASGIGVPGGTAVASDGSVYVAGWTQNQIFRWSPSVPGLLTVVGNQPSPYDVAVNLLGEVFVADHAGQAIRRLATPSNVAVVAGLSYPRGVSADGRGNVIISDTGNHSIKQWSAATGSVSTLLSSGLNLPYRSVVDAQGALYIADTFNSQIKMVPRAFVPTSSVILTSSAGTGHLSAVLPAVNLRAPFQPVSDQTWLTITSADHGVISYSYTASAVTTRSAKITLLGREITFTQRSAPQITHILPATANPLGGTKITLTGSYFGQDMLLRIGGTVPLSFNVISDTLATAVLPPSAPGPVPVDIIIGPQLFPSTVGVTFAKQRSMAGTILNQQTPLSEQWSGYFRSVAMSANGMRLRALTSAGRVLLSEDAGGTWSFAADIVGANASSASIACSADGTRIVVACSGMPLMVSSDGGNTWAQLGPTHTWNDVTCSADGNTIMGTHQDSSTMSGLTVIENGVAAESLTWTGGASARLACSADGRRILVADTQGNLRRSLDCGASWTTQSVGNDVYFSDIACSADGSRVYVVGNGLHTSTDTGITWTSHILTNHPFMVTCSADGMRVAVARFGGLISTSADGGIVWKDAGSPPGNPQWSGIAMSADGSRMAVTTLNKDLYLSTGFLQPEIDLVSPARGPAAGGTNITITGRDFTGATGGDLGGVALTNVTVVNDTTITATTAARQAGLVSLSIRNPDLTAVQPNAFTYLPAPTFTSLTPSSGFISGGTQVTVTGQNFAGATLITLGGNTATQVFTITDTTITFITPSGMAGPADLDVFTPGGRGTMVGAFTYQHPPPTLSTITPDTGPTSGGTSVTLGGQNFTGATRVRIGLLDATQVVVWSPTMITCVTPVSAAGAGKVSVSVTTPGGTVTVPSFFTYVAPIPIILTLSPPSGSSLGGNTITLSGSGFSGTPSVTFGTQPATSVQMVDSTTLRAVAPRWVSGSLSVPVTVISAGNTSNTQNYTYQLTGLQQWRQTWYGSPANTGMGADAATPHPHGLSNLLVYALMGSIDPATARVRDLPQVQLINGRLAYVLAESGSNSGVLFGAEWSPSLHAGSWQPVTDTGSGLTHIFLMPGNAGSSGFMRLKLTAR